LGGNNDDDDPAVKSTNPYLVSSDDHDLYVALKWTSLVTMQAIHSFLQASADLAAVPSSSSSSHGARIPSFVRVSYLSNENKKTAKY
jgi:hypothetical protein